MLEKKIIVASFDVFPNSTMKPSALQQYMQQLAREDCDAMGYTYKMMREVNMVFVLTKLGMKINKPVFAYDELTVKTYQNRVSGIIWEREFEFYRDGEEVIHATTQWVVVKYDTRQIVRPRDFPGEIASAELECNHIDIPRAFDTANLDFVGDRVVRLSDLDENDHLNNCVYSAIFLDVLPFNRKEDFVKELFIIFRQEAKIGDVLKLSSAEKEGRYVVSAYNSTGEKPCFDAECVLGKISG